MDILGIIRKSFFYSKKVDKKEAKDIIKNIFTYEQCCYGHPVIYFLQCNEKL